MKASNKLFLQLYGVKYSKISMYSTVVQGCFEMCVGNLTENLYAYLSCIFVPYGKKGNDNATVTAATTSIMCYVFTNANSQPFCFKLGFSMLFPQL
jgi:hypothetical protein